MNETVTEITYFKRSTINDLNSSITLTTTAMNTNHIKSYPFPLIAPMVFVGFLTMIGIPGNILVLVVYRMKRKPSAQRTIILTMAVYDLFVCTITLPFEFYDLFIHLNFPELWICKIFRTFNYFFVFNSSSIIQVMTIERFRRVCRPLQIQMSARIALMCIITICLASAVVTIPNLFIRGIHTVRFGDNHTGHDCSIADKFIGSKLVIYYNAALLMISIGNIASVVIQYIFIGRQIYKHFQFLKRFRSHIQLKNQTSVISFISIEDNTTCDRPITEYNQKRCKTVNNNKAVVNAGDRSSYKSTLIAVIVSVFFIISYVPTLTENVLEAIYGEEYIGMFISLPVRNIIEKTFAINHVVNPFIYGFLDTKFRTDCREILNCC